MNVADAASKATLLIVDDSPLNVKLLKFMLEEARYDTLAARTGPAKHWSFWKNTSRI